MRKSPVYLANDLKAELAALASLYLVTVVPPAIRSPAEEIS